MKKPGLKKTGNNDLDYNFNQVGNALQGLADLAGSKTVSVDLIAGDNQIVPTVANPQGRLLLFQSAAATLFDRGLNTLGKWVINSSAPCAVRIAFF